MSDISITRQRRQTPIDLPPVATPAPAEPTFVPAKRRSFPAFRTIMALVLREMTTRYGRTIGGYFWAVVEPVAAVMVLSFAFSLLLRTPPLGTSFILFFATGYMPFYIYQQLSSTISRAIAFSKPLLFYPAVTWLDAVIARAFLNAFTAVMVGYLIIGLVLLMLDTRTVIDIGPILVSVLLAIFLGFGIGVMNCAIIGLYPTWEVVWAIITRPLFIASGILFVFEDIPRFAQDVLWYNPLIHIIGLFRQGIYPMYTAQYVSIAFVVAISIMLSTLGMALLHRHHQRILQNL